MRAVILGLMVFLMGAPNGLAEIRAKKLGENKLEVVRSIEATDMAGNKVKIWDKSTVQELGIQHIFVERGRLLTRKLELRRPDHTTDLIEEIDARLVELTKLEAAIKGDIGGETII